MWHVRDSSKTGVDGDCDKVNVVREVTEDWTKVHPLATKLLIAMVSITVTYVTKWVLNKIDARNANGE